MPLQRDADELHMGDGARADGSGSDHHVQGRGAAGDGDREDGGEGDADVRAWGVRDRGRCGVRG